MIDWNTVIATLLASSTMLGIMGFVAKGIITQLLSRDIEKYKANNQIEIERFRAELERSAFEHQTRYQSLHIKRAETIAELYELLVQASIDLASFTNFYQEGGVTLQIEKGQKAVESGRALFEFFEKKRIYFKQDSCERISSFILELRKVLIDFGPVLDDLVNLSNGKERTEQWAIVLEELNNKLPPIKNEIEQEFRKILGL